MVGTWVMLTQGMPPAERAWREAAARQTQKCHVRTGGALHGEHAASRLRAMGAPSHAAIVAEVPQDQQPLRRRPAHEKELATSGEFCHGCLVCIRDRGN